MAENGAFSFLAGDSDAGLRLDAYIATKIPVCSRSFAARLITTEHILVNHHIRKPGYRLNAGDRIKGRIPPPEPVEYRPEPIPLNILYEDQHLVVVNKQPGLVVHPAPGHYSGTLVNALLYHCPDLGGIGGEIRPGIVHRLDKDTSGTLLVAKNSMTHEKLSLQFKERAVRKEYLALVLGTMASEKGHVRLPIGRHPVHRKRMSALSSKSRDAETIWRVREEFGGATLLRLNLLTGRTHQIRVHVAAIHHPVVGDTVYGSRKMLKNLSGGSKRNKILADLLGSASRQMLHAWRLGFTHPARGEFMTFESPLPEDMNNLINKLRDVSQLDV